MITLPDGREFYCCPDLDTPEVTLEAFLNFIQTAQKTLLIADYSFNLPQFETVLPALKAKGVEIRLVLDKSQSAGSTEKPIITTLQTTGIDMVIGTSSDHKIMHNKFCVIDGETSQYGSWNYTVSASDEDNFYFIDKTPQVASALTAAWQRMYTYITTKETSNASSKS